MVEKFQSDILIEGGGITAVAIAYFLSKRKNDQTINLVLKQPEKNVFPHFNPGIALPIFKLPLSLMEKIYLSSNRIFKDIHSITSYFEFTQNPLLLIYRDKKTLDLIIKHKEKLENSRIKHSSLSIEDIEAYYPFLNTEKELKILEIYNSFTCSNPFEVFISFQKLAEENNVNIIRENEELKIGGVRSFKTNSTHYEAVELAITTSNHNLQKQQFQRKSVIKLVTPIFERFPRISLIDLCNSSFMWLEEAGYFHILKTANKTNESEILKGIKNDFNDIFNLTETLKVLDTNIDELEISKSITESVGYTSEYDLFHFNIPLHLEFSLSASLAERFAQINDKNLKEKKENLTLESLYDN